jgi:arylsulfatase A
MKKSIFVGLVLVLAVSSCVASSPQKAVSRPNIILIMADDMGYGDCGVYNPDSKIKTPNIDQLAKEGLRFTDAHSASNTCTPSRYGLLTGINPARTGVRNTLLSRGDPVIDQSEATIASLFKAQGYATKMIGKWHLGYQMDVRGRYDFSKSLMGGPLDHGFDYFFGLASSPGASPLCYFKDRGVVKEPTEKINVKVYAGPGKWKTIKGDIAPGFVQEEVGPNFCKDAVEIIRAHAASRNDKPLFLYYASPLPHKPWVPAEKWKGKSGVGPYGDFMMQLDDVVGQINNALKQTGLDKNTILIFSSDNGPSPPAVKEMGQFDHNSAWVLKGQKASAYEGGHRIPLIVKWPGKVPANSISKTTLNHTDFFATFSELLDVDVHKDYSPSPVDSHSFLPAMLEPSKRFPRPLMVNARHTIRKDDWKLVSLKRNSDPTTLKESDFKLFDLAEDLSEKNDISKNYLERTECLFEEFGKFAENRELK